ncbi:MAG: IS21 family transposase [Acetobacter fabarum]|uniref:IS21 family transposase n=1 Tax=Acetobacter fabarum TaxID=483199 RepID=UPI0039ED93EE
MACDGGMSQREASRHFGISRDTVRKMMAYSAPLGYRRQAPVRRPKLDAFIAVIDRWLDEDRTVPRKQRHTAKRVFDRLRDEQGFTGGYTIIKDYMRDRLRRGQEMFVPLAHPAGHAQADFGEAVVVIGGVEQKAYFFVLDLPHSDACYVRAYPAAVAEAWVDGHIHAFSFFEAVPQSIVYDNDRCLVAKILPDGTRKRAALFSGFLSHYLVQDRYGRPGKGNDKGSVEGLVGYARRNFMVPIPHFTTWDAFNLWLEAQCRKRQGDRLRGETETICDRLQRDLAAMRPLPASPFDACDHASGRVSSQALVRFKTNDYSVPVAFGHQDVWIRGYVDAVVIGCGGGIIARHSRSYEREEVIFDPLHYLPLIEHKINALDQAAPLQGWELPEAFPTMRRLMEARMGKQGRRAYVQLLRLLENFDLADLHVAVKQALHLGAISFDAVKHLVLCRAERRPPRLDLDIYPYLPRATVETTSAKAYMRLLDREEEPA